MASEGSRWSSSSVNSDTATSASSIYLQGSTTFETIDSIHARRPPMIPVSSSLRL